MRHKRIHKLKTGFAQDITNLYCNAARFHWDTNRLSEYRRDIFNRARQSKIPQYAIEFLRGVDWHCNKMHWQLLVYSYEINGMRLAIDSDEYRKIPPQDVCELWLHTGAFIYRDSGDLFTIPGEAKPVEKKPLMD